MSDSVNKFERFRQEHARLHDPALERGAVELVPAELSEFAAGDAAGRKGKKKRHGTRAGWAATPSAAQPSAEPPEGESLLPAGFLRKLSAQSRGGAAREATPAEADAGAARGGPRVACEPVSVAYSLSLFQEQAFALDAPAARQVDLVWREDAAREDGGHAASPGAPPPDTRPAGTARPGEQQQQRRVPMDHTQGSRFETRIGIAAGPYLFAFAVDGHMRPDARYARRVLLGGGGLFAPLSFARYEQKLTLTNERKFAERVRLEPGAPWLVPARAEIVLPPRGSAETTVRFRLPEMRPGPNEALLRLSVERDEGAVAAGAIHFAAHVEVGGAVPEISFAPRELGEVRRGIDEAVLRVGIAARGSGPLSGVISLPQSLVDFRLSADGDDAPPFEQTFRIAAAALPPPQPRRTEAALKLLIRTDSFLANYRVFRAEIPYRLVYLKPLLPALSFGTVRAGETKAMRLEVERSDGEEIELSVVLPAAAAPYLEARPARADAYIFRFDAGALPPGTDISETVELIDSRSGLREQIKVLAKVAPGADESAPAAAASNAS